MVAKGGASWAMGRAGPGIAVAMAVLLTGWLSPSLRALPWLLQLCVALGWGAWLLANELRQQRARRALALVAGTSAAALWSLDLQTWLYAAVGLVMASTLARLRVLQATDRPRDAIAAAAPLVIGVALPAAVTLAALGLGGADAAALLRLELAASLRSPSEILLGVVTSACVVVAALGLVAMGRRQPDGGAGSGASRNLAWLF